MKRIKWIVVITVGATVVAVVLERIIVPFTPGYTYAKNFLVNNDYVRFELGTIRSARLALQGYESSCSRGPESGRETEFDTFVIVLRGTKGKGKGHILVIREESVWRVVKFDLLLPEDRTIRVVGGDQPYW